MDAAIEKLQQDNWRLRLTVYVIVLFVVCVGSRQTIAQVARVGPRGPDMSIEHSLTNDPQAFPPVQWRIQNAAFGNGCVVNWTAEAFALQGNAAIRADCDLAVQVDGGTRAARWKVTKAFDSTRLSGGKDTASVEVTSIRRGNAEVSLQLRFLYNNPVACLATGSYHTTLTGTITAP